MIGEVGPVSRQFGATAVFDAYWRFAVERQRVFFRRLRDDLVLTTDSIIAQHRFTNAYRAADRVSQYLISHVIPGSQPTPNDLFFRILLFKIFNKIDTWEYLESRFGQLHFDMPITAINSALTERMAAGNAIYSAAYIMPAPDCGQRMKHENHLLLLASMMRERMPERWASSCSLRELFNLLSGVRSLGPFLAFQYAIDLGYADIAPHDEGSYVVAGPGARNGLAKCFARTGRATPEELIMAVCEAQEEEFRARGLDFISLYGRRLQPVDCQNLFCEVDKYARVHHPNFAAGGRSRIKQVYRRAGRPLDPLRFPRSWSLEPSADWALAIPPAV